MPWNAVRGVLVGLLLVAVAAGCAYPSVARPACADAVLDDWTKGTLDSTYPADCYDAAIDALPEDLRSYTTAADDISRAAMAASREAAPTRQLASAPVERESVSGFPFAVVLLAATVTLLVASGLGASLIRRRRAR
jgi:hypothetical protein